jgi:Patatin-like phospholipase
LPFDCDWLMNSLSLIFSNHKTMENTLLIPQNPLGKIALSFSGGGFRATAFCLGNLSYLNYRMVSDDKGNQETLLSRVEFISSASGGSFANLGYAQFLYSDRPFAECYQFLKQFMTGTDLLEEVLNNLKDDKVWKNYPHKGRNLINAFAIAYEEKLFEGANLGLLNNPANIKSLREVCVNSTEFEDGMSFRFQNSDGLTRTGMVGNGYLYLSTDKDSLPIVSKIHLADIVAASSCFPGGFEPLIFPDDFAHKDLTINELYSVIYSKEQEVTRHTEHKAMSKIPEVIPTLMPIEAKEMEGKGSPNPTLKFALMDGGIDDNQGINSMMQADDRARRKNEDFDTMIVCDVGSNFMEPYLPVKEDKTSFLGKFSLTSLSRFYFIACALLIGIGCYLLNEDSQTYFPIVLITLGGFGLIVGALLYWKLRSIYEKATEGSWGNIINKYVGYFFKIRTSVLIEMIAARAESVLKMTTSIFMIQIRRLSYKLFYEHPEWENRRVSVLIYELSTKGFPDTKKRLEKKLPENLIKILTPTEQLSILAQQAREMGTTLWFDENNMDKRDKIIATGQFTMCFNLLVYLLEIESINPLSDSLKMLKQDLINDWIEFNKNPMWMV